MKMFCDVMSIFHFLFGYTLHEHLDKLFLSWVFHFSPQWAKYMEKKRRRMLERLWRMYAWNSYMQRLVSKLDMWRNETQEMLCAKYEICYHFTRMLALMYCNRVTHSMRVIYRCFSYIEISIDTIRIFKIRNLLMCTSIGQLALHCSQL